MRGIVRAMVGAGLALAAGVPARAVTFNLAYGSGIVAGSGIDTGVRAAAYYWGTVLTDKVTVNIAVGLDASTPGDPGLGSSTPALRQNSAADWTKALQADARTPLDQSVTQHLPGVPSGTVALNTAVMKAIGLRPATATASDGSIAFNAAAAFDYDTRDGFQGTTTDFVAVAVHEIGHVLGFTSAVSASPSGTSVPANTDLFRYQRNATNVGQWSLAWGGDPYFSIDGGATAFLGASFENGIDGYQPSHWADVAHTVDAAGCTVSAPEIGIMNPTLGACEMGVVTAPDLAMFDAMGWDLDENILQDTGYAKTSASILQDYFGSLSPAPEPATWATMLLGFALLGAALRRARDAAEADAIDIVNQT